MVLKVPGYYIRQRTGGEYSTISIICRQYTLLIRNVGEQVYGGRPYTTELVQYILHIPMGVWGCFSIQVFVHTAEYGARIATGRHQGAVAHHPFRIGYVHQHLFDAPFAIGITVIVFAGGNAAKKAVASFACCFNTSVIPPGGTKSI